MRFTRQVPGFSLEQSSLIFIFKMALAAKDLFTGAVVIQQGHSTAPGERAVTS